MNNEERITQLENQVRELLSWKQSKERQQIAYPLDEISKNIINEDFMRLTSSISYFGGVGSNSFIVLSGKQGGKEFQLDQTQISLYTVNTTTDYITTSGNLNFFNDTPVSVFTDDTAPSPLSAGTGTVYYVINSDGKVFQLSATLGGAAINLTTSGSGHQLILYS